MLIYKEGEKMVFKIIQPILIQFSYNLFIYKEGKKMVFKIIQHILIQFSYRELYFHISLDLLNFLPKYQAQG